MFILVHRSGRPFWLSVAHIVGLEQSGSGASIVVSNSTNNLFVDETAQEVLALISYELSQKT